ncbi:hypothetical protein BOX15_Mlig008061g1 [Macrostomum lignano]|uniref:Cyclin N-terminal domain-containing protein n=1 Tax=Macrostomum lignano TaxID=282301 RepID=A0A267FF93_9PLAT|nr:hypothetical protein BOX15_Mlig014136g1 [Macrostomum lignano]PAA72460.1 hypothetical protein BOX15_Mlig008061g1 [Macrostomum lignano]
MSKKAMSEIGPPQNFIYPLEKILNCAGVVPGDDVFTHERDMCARRKTAQIIQQIGVGLKCAQVVMNAAIIMMHRLLIYWPSHKLPLGKVAAACFFLAAKMEDCPRRLAYVVQQYFRHERQVADIKQVSDEEMSQVGEEIVLLESLILPCLGFNLTITHPHNMLSRGCRALNLPRPLIQTAYYNCTNLLHLTMMVLRLRPETLAAACVQMAASWSNTDLPSVTETDGKYWFNYFDPSMTPELLKAAVDECIAELTKVPPEEKKTVKLLTKAAPTPSQLMQLQQQQIAKRQQDREAAAKAAKAAAAAAAASASTSTDASSAPSASGDSSSAATAAAAAAVTQHSRPAAALTIDEYKKRRQNDAAAAAQSAAGAGKPSGPAYHHHQQQQQQRQQLPWLQHHRQQQQQSQLQQQHHNNHQHHSHHSGQHPHHSGQHPNHHYRQQQHQHHHHHSRPGLSGSASSSASGSAVVPPSLSGSKRPHHAVPGDFSSSAGDANQSKKHKPSLPHYFTK